MKPNSTTSAIVRDAIIVALSVIVAVVLVKTGALGQLIAAASDYTFLRSFIAGFFFTSVFTTAPAIAALGEISLTDSLLTTAIFGGIGAVCGDFIIFRFLKDRLSSHLVEIVGTQGGGKRWKKIFRLKLFRWMSFLVGAAIIASPLPDEIGLSLLGFSRIKTSRFLVLSFVLNSVGIFILGLAARAIVN